MSQADTLHDLMQALGRHAIDERQLQALLGPVAVEVDRVNKEVEEWSKEFFLWPPPWANDNFLLPLRPCGGCDFFGKNRGCPYGSNVHPLAWACRHFWPKGGAW